MKPKSNESSPKKKEMKDGQRPSSKATCPLKATTNNPDWYTQDGAPMVGANFGKLLQLNPDEGVSTSILGYYDACPVIPYDKEKSFFTKMVDLYQDIREKNSGAANYDPMEMAAYFTLYRMAAIDFIMASKDLLSVRANNTAHADAPRAVSAACNVTDYKQIVAGFADFYNRLTLLGKRLSALPMIPAKLFLLDQFRYGTLFFDAKSAKSAMFSFWARLTDVTLTRDDSNHVTEIKCTYQTGSPSMTDRLDHLEGLLNQIYAENRMAILRGDLRNAFGNGAMKEWVVPEQLAVNAEDPEVMSQTENANMLLAGVSFSKMDDTGAATTSFTTSKVTTARDLQRDRYLINWHKEVEPSTGELIAITRLMATKDACDGTIVREFVLITNMTNSALTRESLIDDLDKAQNSQLQSTAISAAAHIAFIASAIDHFPQVYLDKFSDTPEVRNSVWDIDNIAEIYSEQVNTMTSRAIRSLCDAHAPRGPEGRRESKP